MTYDHTESKLSVACGITKERHKEITAEFVSQLNKRKSELMKNKLPTSMILETIENMDWTLSEKLYMADKYGEFTEQIATIAGIADIASMINPVSVYKEK